MCQQASEKFLKAVLEEFGQPVPKIHDLDKLLSRLPATVSMPRSLRRGLLFLTDFAVDTRYPGNTLSKRESASALRWAAKVRDASRAILGIRPPRSRKSP
jgi:HEPN domain-containing protein